MERKGHKYLSFIAAVLCVAGLSAVSCSIEESFSEQDSQDGLPAEIELRLSVPDMSVGTRALTEQQELTVNNIWIGIYDAKSGRLKNRYYYTVSHEDRHNPHFLPPADGGYLKTSSGESYIVAVANAGDSNGISSDPSVGPQDGTLTNLLELLDNADTFDKYKSVAAALPSPSSWKAWYRAGVYQKGIFFVVRTHTPQKGDFQGELQYKGCSGHYRASCFLEGCEQSPYVLHI